ncbi:family 43 glycosylhydrolase [Mucilaginibacter sp. HMF5004]|uniref:family 43 glycosylhydrolase n=1 Tax=Mucilaginibacter rivuli TaxID=2857527 RepID=UPI001C5DEEA4|nr:family 43 glycosylhydrolase [Mucilaginibacter rivuli]MBW4889247.1 family 43 glycosylhydrolase [Mucilaginibacter rivuli]
MKKTIIVLLLAIAMQNFAFAQKVFTPDEIAAIANNGSGISGPGKPIEGAGWGDWRDGAGKGGPSKRATGSVVANGLLPSIKPILDAHIRDAVVILGGDCNYYLTGSTGDNIWAHADGVELWRSKDLKNWNYMGLVWTIEKDGTWEKKWADLHGKPARALWAPELHYIKGNYYICLSMPPTGISILKSTTGKPEGPYVNTAADPSQPFVKGIDPTLLQDDDGKVYFTWAGANHIGLMKNDMSGFDGPLHDVKLSNPDHDPTHHVARCEGRGMNDFGTEGAILFKANGKYYLGAADDYQGRYSSCVGISDNIYGPYHDRHEIVPCGGGTNFFKDKQGNWWSSFFGNDTQSPWREKPGLVRIEFAADGKVVVSKNQPFAVDIPVSK